MLVFYILTLIFFFDNFYINEKKQNRRNIFLGKLGNKLRVMAAACIISIAVLGMSSSDNIKGKWETVKDFSGTVTITRNANWQGPPLPDGSPGYNVIDNSFVTIHVSGTTSDESGSVWGIGSWNGKINFEITCFDVFRNTFSGKIQRKFGADCDLCSPKIRVNKKLGLYKLRLPFPKAKGIYTEYAFGQKKNESESDFPRINPHIPEPYGMSDQGTSYDPSSRIISGSYSITCYGLPGLTGPSDKMFPEFMVPQLPPHLKCPVNHTVSWNFNIKHEDYKVKIIEPKPDDQTVFWEGSMIVTARAKAEPESYNDEIQPWNIDPIEGSELTTDPTPPKGENVFFLFENLPTNNDQFGEKTIYADNADPVTIKVFFEKGWYPQWAKNNREDPNLPDWFYYWRQGAVTMMEAFEYVEQLDSDGAFVPSTGGLYLGPSAATEDYPVTLVLKMPSGIKKLVFKSSKGIDKCARVVVHELKHKEIHDRFHKLIQEAHDQIPSGYWCDFDFDGIPNVIEKLLQPEFNLNPWKADTHNLAGKFGSRDEYKGYADQELLCWYAELGVTGIHEKDWTFPGKQSNPAY
jgi:hypothetical protein